MPSKRRAPPTVRPPVSSTPNAFVRVRGAREHNLKDVSLDVPRDALVVFSGISGSGKSSLAFGTLYAEAQRRYLESVAPYARRLIEQAGVPDVDSIEGLPPAVALQQQRGTPSTRSSVGSVTTLSSLLRLLYSRAGTYPAGQAMLFAEDFSPNTPQGACPNCHGLGRVFEVTESSMVPDPSKSIREGAIASWPPAWHGQNLRDILVTLGHDVDIPWRKLSAKERDWILFTEERPTAPVYAGFSPAETRQALKRKTEPSYQGTFIGARRYVLHTFATTQSALMKNRVARFMSSQPCPVCDGKRLKRASLRVTFAGLDIGEMAQQPLSALVRLLAPAVEGRFDAPRQASAKRATARKNAATAASQSTPDLSPEKQVAAQRIAFDVVQRVAALLALGLCYLSLDRSTPTLSPGELQRLRLATQIRSNLFGVVYVLDEPSAGLHPADSAALFDTLVQLKQAGNSVFVVEHDMDMVRRADWVVDVGPGAGSQGGQVVYSGPPAGLASVSASVTARFLATTGTAAWPIPRAPQQWLQLEGIRRNNLQGLDVRMPLGVLCAVTGVSGSGKSSLVSQVLVELVGAQLGRTAEPEDAAMDLRELATPMPVEGRLAEGAEAVRRLVCIDQRPIGRTPRSNLATYTGLFDEVRNLFAQTPAAKARRFDAGRFSFNVAKGRCPTCEGEGSVSVELVFMPSVYAPCPACHGARYNAPTLAVTWQDKNIAQVLDLTVEQAIGFFENAQRILTPLRLLHQLGLGYLRLGQPATELSGGEAQRIKLAKELQRSSRGGALYILDEPTTGLHPADVDRLMQQLDELVAGGHSVVVVEHDMRVVARCDWVIDMGPGAGADGGRIVAEGPPQSVALASASRTAPFLREALDAGVAVDEASGVVLASAKRRVR